MWTPDKNVPTVPALLALVLLVFARDGMAAPDTAGPPSADALDNLTYVGIADQPITLEDGRWAGAPYVEGGASRPTAGRVAEVYLDADLDADGHVEAVTLLWESSGGSGSNSYLAVAGRRDGQVANLATALIGDRVQLRAARIQDGYIELDVVQQGPGDAACCPTETATRRWQFSGDSLKEMELTRQGKLSLHTLQGPEWVLTHIGHDQPVPEGVEVTLRFTDEGVGGRSGCNRYFGSASAGEQPGTLSFGPMAGTRMACPEPAMGFETRYLEALGAVTGFGFRNGQLVLTSQLDDAPVTLLFTAREIP